MYYKIARLILNTAKTLGMSDVYIAQPSSLKENLAGKVFILAEIGGKPNDARKIFDYLVASLEDNYYNDEKIALRDKIAGLKIENIFEAALAKTNKSLTEFLLEHKLRINSAVTNITLGLIYEDKLHFSNFGKNRALLIYGRGDKYNLINVETSAAETGEEKDLKPASQAPLIFSSIISGEIPINSYFFFANEFLPEYLSERETINIITKLPPVVATEQIKNVLSKINTHVSFLGLIIKNTVGLEMVEQKEENLEVLSAHNSISSLNHTEQKTEQMLAPAGLINFTEIFKGGLGIFKKISQPRKSLQRLKVVKPTSDSQPKISEKQPNLNLGQIRSLNYPGANLLPLTDKIFFRKKSYWLKGALTKIFSIRKLLFRVDFWSNFSVKLKIFFGAINYKNRLTIFLLAAVIIIFITSLLFTNSLKKRQEAETNFNNLVVQITDKETQIDSYLLYNNESGARTVLQEALSLVASLPRDKKYQSEIYNQLLSKLTGLEEKVQKIVRVNTLEKLGDLQGLEVKSIVWAAGKIYGASDKKIYDLSTVSSSTPVTWDIATANSLRNPLFDNKDNLYYWDNNSVFKFNIKTKQIENLFIAGGLKPDDSLTSFKVFNNNLYSISRRNNQIYFYKRNGATFGASSNWLKETADLSKASDLYIDGDIYILENTGAVVKFFKGNRQTYAASAIFPEMNQAQKIIVGSKYLYIFEASSQRLVVLAKPDGQLLNQYKLDSLSQLQDFAINEIAKQAYFLDQTGLYSLKLNQ